MIRVGRVRQKVLNWHHHLCPTGRWFWLRRRDLSKPGSLANVWTPTTAAVARHVHTTLMTPTPWLTPTYIHTHWSSPHFTSGQKTLQLCHSGCMQSVCNEIFLSPFPFFQCQRVLIHFLSVTLRDGDTFIVLSCTHFHHTPHNNNNNGARVRANQTL